MGILTRPSSWTYMGRTWVLIVGLRHLNFWLVEFFHWRFVLFISIYSASLNLKLLGNSNTQAPLGQVWGRSWTCSQCGTAEQHQSYAGSSENRLILWRFHSEIFYKLDVFFNTKQRQWTGTSFASFILRLRKILPQPLQTLCVMFSSRCVTWHTLQYWNTAYSQKKIMSPKASTSFSPHQIHSTFKCSTKTISLLGL